MVYRIQKSVILSVRAAVLQGGSLPTLEKEGRWCKMGTYEVLSLLFLGGTFLNALLAYIRRRNKQKKNPALQDSPPAASR